MDKLKVQFSHAMVYKLVFLTQNIQSIAHEIKEAVIQYPDLIDEPIILDMTALSCLPDMDMLKDLITEYQLHVLAITTQHNLQNEVIKWGFQWVHSGNLSNKAKQTPKKPVIAQKLPPQSASKPAATNTATAPQKTQDEWTDHVYAANKALRARKQAQQNPSQKEVKTKEAFKEHTPTVEATTISSTVAQNPPPKTLVHRGAVRSGQRIYAQNTDLIIIGTVSAGAEIIADGHISVYGPLRGRALAGAKGDTNATIFTTHLNAELISIAGIYKTIETPLDVQLNKQTVLIQLEDEHLKMSSEKELN